jgi:hypothetical protein
LYLKSGEARQDRQAQETRQNKTDKRKGGRKDKDKDKGKDKGQGRHREGKGIIRSEAKTKRDKVSRDQDLKTKTTK